MSSQYDCLFYSLFWLTTKKTPNVPVTGLLGRESTSGWWISTQRPVYYGKFSMSWRHQEAMEIHTRKWLIVRETSCRNDINKLLAIECDIIDIMSVFNTTGILFPDIQMIDSLIPVCFKQCNVTCPVQIMENVLPIHTRYHHNCWYCWLTIRTHCGRNKMAAILQTFWTSFS